MQFWLLLCLFAGMSWGWCLFAAIRKIGTAWVALLLGLSIGVGCFLTLWVVGGKTIQRLKLFEPQPPFSRLLVAWSICGAMLLFTFMAPWGVSWIIKWFGSN